MKRPPIYGMIAEFDSATNLVAAAHRTHEAGYTKIDAYSPFPVEGLAEAIGFHRNEVPLVVLIGGLLGGLSAYAMQYWISAVSYPINVGGMPYHSVFNVPRFAFATKDRFFLIVFSSDPKYDATETRRFLESLGPKSISEVPN